MGDSQPCARSPRLCPFAPPAPFDMSSGPSCASAGSTILIDITDNPTVAGAKPSAVGATVAKAKWKPPEFKMQLQVNAGYGKSDQAVESDVVFVVNDRSKLFVVVLMFSIGYG